ncbi:MAG: magnesium transporter [Xanthobacteraceae bacterium]|nr:magnesium transporter [Xanthobacteraceae bacterium]QYK43843.1 MAG: magnesium transporter [Xanthobacteraceae bacterium]HMN52145.1 magnesium transporter [Xanthobacteraceae bacterium]
MAEAESPAGTRDADLLLPLRNEDGEISAAFLEAISRAVETADVPQVRALAGDLHEADLGDLIEALETEQRPRLVELLGSDFDFAALTEVDDTVREEILEELPNEIVAEGVRDLESDDAVRILEDLPEEDKTEILEKLPQDEREELARGLEYPEESAGRRMQTDFVAVPPDWTVGQTIDYAREDSDLPDSFYAIFVADEDGRFVAAVPLDKLLRSQRPVKISDIMVHDWHVVQAKADQEDAARMFERYNLVSAPVVDDDGKLVGVLTVDDVVDVIEEEAAEDIKALGGVNRNEEISDSVAYTARSRLPWLVINMVMAFAAAAIIGLFSHSIEQMVALAVLMPIVASMGGNAGTQAMTVTVRALATRELGEHNERRIILREVMVGLINGIVVATLLGTLAALWFQQHQLGLVIAFALVVNLCAAGLAGILIPLALDRLRSDPAVASAVFVTTVTDVIGFFSFLGFATWWFRLG